MERDLKKRAEGFLKGSGSRHAQFEFDGPEYGRVGGSFQSFSDNSRWKNSPKAQHYNNDHFGYGPHERGWNKHVDYHYRQANPNYGKGPKNYQRSMELIHDDVCEALSLSPEVDASEIEVNVTEGIVTLTGKVKSRRMKKAAGRAVEIVPGVEDLLNMLSMEGDGPKTTR